MEINIEKYTELWKVAFENEYRVLIKSIKEPTLKIEHIGSTSVEGLNAKPIIDIMIGLQDFDTASNHIISLENLGYEYISEYEDKMSDRKFFIKDSNGVRTHHIHMVSFETEFWNRHLKFRDHLQTNQADREDYLKLKIRLAKRKWKNGSEYANAKAKFIQKIEDKIMDKSY